MLSNKEKHELLALKEQQLARCSLEHFTKWTYPEYEVNEHHRIIFEQIERFIYQKSCDRLMIFAPPRHGKSEIVSRRLPAFLLGINPNLKIIACSYSSDLSSMMNRDVQRIIDSDAYKRIFPNTKLSSSNVRTTQHYLRNSDIFEVVNHTGLYKSCGVGGGITGSGADCFIADTKIVCYANNKLIQDIRPGELVLSYNHDNNQYEFKKVITTQWKWANECIKIKTKNGNKFTCTADHRIFTQNGYCQAIQCSIGDGLIAFNRSFKMQLLQGILYKAEMRSYKSNKEKQFRSLLFKGVLTKSSCYQKQKPKKMRNLWRNSRQSASEILHKMQGHYKFQKVKTNKMSYLRKRIPTKNAFNKNLFCNVRRFITLKTHEKNRKSSVCSWRGISNIIHKITANNNRTRRVSLYNMQRQGKLTSTPYRRYQSQQFSGEFNNIMQPMPYETPQIQSDSISSIERVSIGKIKVYDIQVEDNHNFFAEGILVHNCLIIDDPIKNQEEADSVTYRDKLWDWYTSTAYTRLEKNGKVILMMTRWHEDDLAGRLLSLEKSAPEADKWQILNLPAIAESVRNDNDNRSVGEPLWPNKYSLEKLNTIRASVGVRVWNSLFQQRPSAIEGSLFKRSNWRYYDQLPEGIEKVIQSWDLAFKKRDDSDFVACSIIAKKGANFYLIEQINERLSFTESINAVKNMSQKYPSARLKLVEAKANGDALVDMLKSEIQGLVLVEPKGGKIARAEAITPLHEAGNLYLPNPKKSNWVFEFIEQFANFPNTKNDDMVDSFSQGITSLAGDPRDRLKRILNM